MADVLFDPMLAAVYSVATHSIGKTAWLIHTVKILGELPVEHEIHNSLLPWVQINGAILAVGIEVQLNAWAIGELFACQLSV